MKQNQDGLMTCPAGNNDGFHLASFPRTSDEGLQEGKEADTMRIATWNVNSIKQRLDHLATFVKSAEPDVLCLQELKCVDEAFPKAEVEALGYNVVTHGQKAYNGVAILSKHPLEDVRRGLPGDDGDEQARYLEGVIWTNSGVMRVASIYLPNGNPIGTPKFEYKLAWMDRLHAHARKLLLLEEPLVLCGDYNVIPEPKDAADPAAWTNDALFQPESRAKFRALENLGLSDALRACTDQAGLYSFWDYQAGAFQRNNGIRIDHLLLSPQAQDKLKTASIRKEVRGWDKPSDHVPVMVDLDID
jgi:exodeoxyribonuclease III